METDGASPRVHHRAFWAAFLGFLTAQIAKVFTNWYTERRWDISRLWGSGGMPSSHTALVIGLTTFIGATEGTATSAFALAFVFSLVVCDLVGVRI